MILALAAHTASAEGVWEGVFNYQKKMADYGHPEAQVKLGEMYEEGHGTEQNYDIAQQWYQKAMEQGYALGEEKLLQLEQRRQREAEARKRAEQQRIASEKAAQERREREKAEAEERAEQERLREEQLAREAEQRRMAEERAAAAAADKAKEEERERLARQRAKEAIEKMLATPDGLE
ncbi:MAG: hypothetical protein OQL05_05550 [Gammaproteobacteria bacterium]|nr:hypothetical protein [Gammaproteobacteria bacterium]